jgi:hypothetical protein
LLHGLRETSQDHSPGTADLTGDFGSRCGLPQVALLTFWKERDQIYPGWEAEPGDTDESAVRAAAAALAGATAAKKESPVAHRALDQSSHYADLSLEEGYLIKDGEHILGTCPVSPEAGSPCVRPWVAPPVGHWQAAGLLSPPVGLEIAEVPRDLAAIPKVPAADGLPSLPPRRMWTRSTRAGRRSAAGPPGQVQRQVGREFMRKLPGGKCPISTGTAAELRCMTCAPGVLHPSGCRHRRRLQRIHRGQVQRRVGRELMRSVRAS